MEQKRGWVGEVSQEVLVHRTADISQKEREQPPGGGQSEQPPSALSMMACGRAMHDGSSLGSSLHSHLSKLHVPKS